MRVYINPVREKWNEIVARPVIDTLSLREPVQSILADVKINGDQAVRKYSLQFDKVQPGELLVTEQEIEKASASLSRSLREAIETAASNILRFHERQVLKPEIIETMPGVRCWQRSVGIERVGLYIPGGTAPLFSTVLMLGIPARLARCNEIILCTPPASAGHPAVLFAARLAGVTKIFKVGGVQAIAAMAYGTAAIPRVYKIFGPGNQYVNCAKQLVQMDGIAIDMPAGPSEVCVLADSNCDPSFVAADLLSQAEHGSDSQVMLICDSEGLLNNVRSEVEKQLERLPRREFAQQSLKNSNAVVLQNADEAIDLINDYAPEHLIIARADAHELCEKIINAGSIFLGNYSPESAGDYASGTNHTLPTNGFAKSFSGVSVDSFVKKITCQELTMEGLERIGNTIEEMAAAEGLEAHKNAVSIRLKKIN